MSAESVIKAGIGDYVLATKYEDGDPHDHWVCGWLAEVLDRYDPPRYDVVDNDRESFRGNGFRRVERISMGVGKKLVELGKEMRFSGKSVWEIRDKLAAKDPDPCDIGRMYGTDVYWAETMRYDERTTAVLMRSTTGARQKVLLADEELEAIVLTKYRVVDLHLGRFIEACVLKELRSASSTQRVEQKKP